MGWHHAAASESVRCAQAFPHRRGGTPRRQPALGRAGEAQRDRCLYVQRDPLPDEVLRRSDRQAPSVAATSIILVTRIPRISITISATLARSSIMVPSYDRQLKIPRVGNGSYLPSVGQDRFRTRRIAGATRPPAWSPQVTGFRSSQGLRLQLTCGANRTWSVVPLSIIILGYVLLGAGIGGDHLGASG